MIGRGFKMAVPPAAVSAGKEGDKPAALIAEVVEQFVGVGVFDNAARRQRNNTVGSFCTEPF